MLAGDYKCAAAAAAADAAAAVVVCLKLCVLRRPSYFFWACPEPKS